MSRALPSFKRKLASFAALLREGQCFEAARRLCSRCVSPRLALLGKSHLLLWQRSDAVRAAPPGPCRFREASPRDLPGILECSDDSGNEDAAGFFQGLFAAGRRCYVAEVSGRIAGYCWLFFGRYVITHDAYRTSNVVVALSERSAFIGNVFVRPDCRRRGLYSSLLSVVLHEAETAYGRSRVFVDVKADNAASLRAHARSGFAAVATLYYLGLPGTRLLVVAPGAKRTRVHRVTGNPVLTL